MFGKMLTPIQWTPMKDCATDCFFLLLSYKREKRDKKIVYPEVQIVKIPVFIEHEGALILYTVLLYDLLYNEYKILELNLLKIGTK